MEIKRAGSQASMKGLSDYFTGTVRIDPLFQAPAPAHVSMARTSSGWSRSVTTSTAPSNVRIEERTMPHVIVKLWPGKSEQQKRRLAAAITKDVASVLNYGDESVSVALEEVAAAEWGEKVYRPDIVEKAATLYKKPGYEM